MRAWAESLPPEGEPLASDNFILNRISFMQAALPARAIDDEAGEKRAAVYLSILRGQSRAAMEYLADRACRELRWFPTPRDCLDILAEYRKPLTECQWTLISCDNFANAALQRWLDGLRDGQPIGDVPEQWLRIAAEQCLLRKNDDETYEHRV